METDTLLATGSINVVPQDYGANSGSAEHGHPDNGSPGFGTRSPNSVGDNESCPVKGGELDWSSLIPWTSYTPCVLLMFPP